MLALEIQINQRECIVVAADNLACISLSSIRNSDSIEIFGGNDSSYCTWLKEKVQTGDKIRVRIVDVEKEKISSPQIVKMKDRKEMKQEFEQLRMELQNRHLL